MSNPIWGDHEHTSTAVGHPNGRRGRRRAVQEPDFGESLLRPQAGATLRPQPRVVKLDVDTRRRET